jgi:hypothetical protein
MTTASLVGEAVEDPLPDADRPGEGTRLGQGMINGPLDTETITGQLVGNLVSFTATREKTVACNRRRYPLLGDIDVATRGVLRHTDARPDRASPTRSDGTLAQPSGLTPVARAVGVNGLRS